MVSYMKKMIWGDQATQAAARGAAGEESKDDGDGTVAATNFNNKVTPD